MLQERKRSPTGMAELGRSLLLESRGTDREKSFSWKECVDLVEVHLARMLKCSKLKNGADGLDQMVRRVLSGNEVFEGGFK